MNDVPVVGRLDAVDQLPDDGHRLVELERPLQRLALDVLHDQVVRADIVKLADVGVIQRRDGSGLAFKALAELFFAELDGDDAAQARVASLVHLTHAARADGRDGLVRAEALAYG